MLEIDFCLNFVYILNTFKILRARLHYDIIVRAVASLTVPEGQEFHFPHSFLNIDISYFFLNFSHFLPHFGPRVGESPQKGHGYTTDHNDIIRRRVVLIWYQWKEEAHSYTLVAN